jgi:hypothetical protein
MVKRMLLLLRLPAADRNPGKVQMWWTGTVWYPSESEMFEIFQKQLLMQQLMEAVRLL